MNMIVNPHNNILYTCSLSLSELGISERSSPPPNVRKPKMAFGGAVCGNMQEAKLTSASAHTFLPNLCLRGRDKFQLAMQHVLSS